MRRPDNALWLLIAGASMLWPVCQASEPLRIPENIFGGEPRGPHRTGTFEELWIDTAREETTTADPADKRHLMVQFWYPARFQGDPPRAPYALHRELYPRDEQARWLDDSAAVRTTSVLNAPPDAGRFPVLIYNPGAEHPPFSATFQTEFLASHGYVVVAIGHSDVTRIERFPDGVRYQPAADTTFLQDVNSTVPFDVARLRELAHKYATTTMRTHVQDIGFVLDRLHALNESRHSRWHGRLDLEHVGSLGWSFGGALSLQASRDEPRIKAAANLDGWLYTDVQDTGTHRPILQMHGAGVPSQRLSQPAAARELSLVAQTFYWQLYANSDADWYDLTLERAEHPHFSDRPLFEPREIGLMHPRLAHEIINRVTLEFFDKYLRGVEATPLLSGDSRYPDTVLLKSVAAGRTRS